MAASAGTSLTLGSAQARWVLAATVLGSGLAFIDATVVSIALPAIAADLVAGTAGLTWTVNGYTLTLAALILLGGSLGDRLGRRRVFVTGVVWFAVASALCGLAPTVEVLVVARALQGVGGALLTPGSLAILQATFREEDRSRAIGVWSGMAGVAGAVGPFLGGWLVDLGSWRWVFWVNLPLALAVVVLALRFVPETRDPAAARTRDLTGAALVALGLGALTYGLTVAGEAGPGDRVALLSGGAGVLLLAGFTAWERWVRAPMLPLDIFSSRLFTAGNLVTFAVYAALGGVFVWLVVTLQVVAEFSPVTAGLALLPVTVLMLGLSERAGLLAERIGPRLPMTVGPLVAAAGVAWMAGVDDSSTYLRDVLGPVVLLGLGLSLTVAPLTATVLAAVPESRAGLASGVNNAVARTAGLLAVAALPVLTGLGRDGFSDPAALGPAFDVAAWVCAGLLAVGGVLSAFLIRAPAEPAVPEGDHVHGPACPHRHCAVDGPPIAVVEHD